MNSDQWERIEKICQAALDLEPGERSAYLDTACAGEDLLRQEVEKLLAYESASIDLLEKSPGDIAAAMLYDNQEKYMIGRLIDHYRIIQLIGKGGMGEVYLAQDTKLTRKVAIKLLPRVFTTDKNRVLRFEQESRAASSLNHPNILTVYEIGEFESTHFIVTEYVEGKTLRHHLKGQAINLFDVIDIAIQICAALSLAHQAGIIHRDIKPDNIMLRPDGYIKVLDFGLAKLADRPSLDTHSQDSAVVHTDTGVVMGTAHYMSPEQARGQNVDPRTDIFNLGIVMYEMVTGKVPFAGETANHVIVAILEKDPLPLHHFICDIPIDLQSIIFRALRKDREERYQTVDDLMNELRVLTKKLGSDYREVVRAPERRSLKSVNSPQSLIGKINNHKIPFLLIMFTGIGLIILGVFISSKRFNNNSAFQSEKKLDAQPVTISSIFPPSPVDIIGDQGIEVYGANFQENLKINISFPIEGSSTLCCSQILKRTSDSFVLLADFNGNPGRYSIQVINPDGSTSDPFQFVVQHQVQDPIITSIMPSKPTALIEEQSIQVYGNNFQVGVTVKVTLPNKQSAILSGRQVPVRTPSSFKMLIYFNGESGKYRIQAINPNGRKSNIYSFEVY